MYARGFAPAPILGPTLALALALTVGACKADADKGAAELGATASSEAAALLPKKRAGPTPAALALAARVEAPRYRADVEFIAQERVPGSPHWQAVQDRCADTFAAAGFEVERFSTEDGTSVIGRKLGPAPDAPAVVVGAHYDHIEGCAGADDNASGTGAVLELARVLGAESWRRPLILACWDREEDGLLGSHAWVEANTAPIELYVNFDAMAYADSSPNSQRLPPEISEIFPDKLAALEAREYRADFIVVLGDSGAREFSDSLLAHAARAELPAIPVEVPSPLKNLPALADLRRSDHAGFWRRDIPSVFLSDTAEFRTDTYHCTGRPDTTDTLDFEFATKVVRTAAGALAQRLASAP